MASKGPKSDGVSAVVAKDLNAPLAAKPAKAPKLVKPSIPAALAALSPPPAAVPAPVAPEPVLHAAPALHAPEPVPAPKPEPAAAVVAQPAPEPAPVVAAPIAQPTPEPAPVAQAPVMPEPTAPAAAPAPALNQKDVIMETIDTATDKTQKQAQAMFTDANDRTKSAMDKGSKMLADMNDFSKGNVEAMVESSKIAAKGAEDVARYTADYARSSVEKANAAARQFAAVKSPTELMKLQSELAKDAVDSMMAETAKFTENYLKLLGEISQPISNRLAVAAEKMKIAA